MLSGLRVSALVPARGGSKGVPGKNLRHVGGVSLLVRAIRCGQDSAFVDEVFVTSDDDAILEVAEVEGATPIKRPPELASDQTEMDPVVAQAVDWIRTRDGQDDFYIVLLQPTSPLRTSQHVDDACAVMQETNATCVLSVVEADKHPLKALVEDGAGYLQGAYGVDAPFRRRQDLPRAVFPNGAVYLFRAGVFTEVGGIPRERLVGLVMEPDESIDIDTEADLSVAERAASARGEG